MYSKSRQIGNIGEEIACNFILRKGYRVICRNYMKPYGEIDIIAEKGGTVRFIEVKTVTRESIRRGGSRENSAYSPEEQVHAEKLRHLGRVVEAYIAQTGETRDYQIDVVAVEMDPGRRIARCRLYEQVL